ncbi:MAG: S9 family peptidase [Balneolaceae bacterium]|nr:S9 family peptidase [Balneolaceae bacterium]
MNARRISGPFYTIFAFLAVLLIVGFDASAQTGPGMTPEQVADIKSVGEIIISDDGNSVAYTLRVQADPFSENKKATYHLYLYNRQTETSIPFFTNASVTKIEFRPRYGSLTFLTKKDSDNTTSVYEISLSGGEARKIYSFKTSIIDFDWAPDGKRIAFMAKEPIAREQTPLPYQPEIYEENLIQRRGYFTNVSNRSSKARQVQVEGSVYQMRWSPDGGRLAVAAAPTPLVDDKYMKQQLKVVDRGGKQVVAEVDHEGKLGQIGWSPDGKRLAMIAGAHIHDPIDKRLLIVPADGGTPTMLKPDFKGAFEQFQWVDNHTLQYLASRGVWSTYGRIDAEGTNMTTVIGTGGPNLKKFARSANGIVAFEADHPTHPDELYLMNGKDKKPKRATVSNPWLGDVELGRQEVVTWEARDGLELQGLLIYPLDYKEGTTYPLITVVHGGPESHYNNGWITSYDDPGQVGAAQGYAVFYPNYRGSTGRGIEFAMSSQGDPAGAEFDDIVDGVDHLIQEGIADRDKIGVTGGSYGGYATGWLSTKYTDRFAAGVMFVGISDNISKWGTSDIPEELYLVHTRKRIWEDYQFFLERSPIYHAGKADTPLLIMAGKEDTRVDPGQSYELYRHIKTRTNTPVRLVLYPGEGHGNDLSSARYDYNRRMMRWFGQYLKGDKDRPDSELELEEMGISN